jgi:hypothetical protein
VLVAVPDERIEVDKSELIAAGSDAKDGIERGDRVVNDNVKPPRS